MKVPALIFCLLASPTLAQQPPAEQPTPAAVAYRLIAHQAMEREAAAIAETAKLNAQVEALTKERDALKKPEPTAP